MLIKIAKQGAPIVNTDMVYIRKTGRGFIAAEIDMCSKWCVAGYQYSGSDGEFGFSIDATERSLHLMHGKERDEETIIEIDGLKSDKWGIFCVECSRYTIRLVLCTPKALQEVVDINKERATK